MKSHHSVLYSHSSDIFLKPRVTFFLSVDFAPVPSLCIHFTSATLTNQLHPDSRPESCTSKVLPVVTTLGPPAAASHTPEQWPFDRTVSDHWALPCPSLLQQCQGLPSSQTPQSKCELHSHHNPWCSRLLLSPLPLHSRFCSLPSASCEEEQS